jgi:hypothetical protein
MLPYIAISQYGLRLHQMRDADIEIVREGRNQPFVRKNYFFKKSLHPNNTVVGTTESAKPAIIT